MAITNMNPINGAMNLLDEFNAAPPVLTAAEWQAIDEQLKDINLKLEQGETVDLLIIKMFKLPFLKERFGNTLSNIADQSSQLEVRSQLTDRLKNKVIEFGNLGQWECSSCNKINRKATTHC